MGRPRARLRTTVICSCFGPTCMLFELAGALGDQECSISLCVHCKRVLLLVPNLRQVGFRLQRMFLMLEASTTEQVWAT